MGRHIVVLASGSGSNLQALIDASDSCRLAAEVALVVSDRGDAYALQRAAAAGIPTTTLPRHDGEARADYDARLADVVTVADADIVVLAGWMRILTMTFLARFPDRVVNLHPALPGELPGTNSIARAFEQFQRGERTHTGVMVHRVPDEGVDDGPVLGTATVAIHPTDTLDTLTERVHATEHRLLVDTIADVLMADSSSAPLPPRAACGSSLALPSPP